MLPNKNQQHEFRGSTRSRPYKDAAACMLGEIISTLLEEIGDMNFIFPLVLYLVKPNKSTYTFEAKSAMDKPLVLDSLFHSDKKKAHFDKRLEILQDCTRIKPFNQKWNKARLIIHDDQRYIFQYKFDRDIHWLYSRQLNGPIVVAELSSDILQKINSWDGLEEAHPRPWEHAYF